MPRSALLDHSAFRLAHLLGERQPALTLARVLAFAAILGRRALALALARVHPAAVNRCLVGGGGRNGGLTHEQSRGGDGQRRARQCSDRASFELIHVAPLVVGTTD